MIEPLSDESASNNHANERLTTQQIQDPSF